MIGIKSTTVNTYDLNSLTVSWEYEHLAPGIDLSSTTIDVQRSEAEDFSSYETVAAGLNASVVEEYTDYILSGIITRRYTDINYRLRFVEATGEETLSSVAWLTQPINLRARDIIRRKNLVLGLHGRTLYFFRRLVSGIPCTVCRDAIMDVQIDGNCTTCYNTGIVGGFASSILFKGFTTSTPDVNLVNRFGEFNPGQMILSTSSTPRLSVNDVIVDEKNRRWWITRINNISHKEYVVSQDAVLTLIDHNDVVYEVSI